MNKLQSSLQLQRGNWNEQSLTELRAREELARGTVCICKPTAGNVHAMLNFIGDLVQGT